MASAKGHLETIYRRGADRQFWRSCSASLNGAVEAAHLATDEVCASW
jgi:hypothetical protein